MIETILKRDGREVPFDASKITYAIERALEATGGKPSEDSAEKLAEQVVCELEAGESVGVPTVEEIQDTVELQQLLSCNTLSEMKRGLDQIVQGLCSREKEDKNDEDIVFHIKNYIQEHYQDNNLNVAEIGRKFGKTGVQLLGIFHLGDDQDDTVRCHRDRFDHEGKVVGFKAELKLGLLHHIVKKSFGLLGSIGQFA